MIENVKSLKGEEPTGTDAEACAYLNTASLTAPMDGDWSQIYLYVAGKTYSRWQKNIMPDDIRVDSLTIQQTTRLCVQGSSYLSFRSFSKLRGTIPRAV
jgi:hypothetical protein